MSCLIRFGYGLFIIRRFRRTLRLASDPRLKKLASNSNAQIYESAIAPTPLTLGWWRTVIVLPEGVGESLNDEQLAAVVAHEAAHVVRRDTLIALLQQLAGIVFWWNPLLRKVSRGIHHLREQICDDYVVKQYGEGTPLAEAILKVAEWSELKGIRMTLGTNLLDDADHLAERITRLTEQNRDPSIRLTPRSVALIGLVGLLFGVVPLVPVVRGGSF